MNDMTHQLPSVEKWWPRLSTHTKHRVLNELESPLSEDVLREIESITCIKFATDSEFFLSESDKRFIRTQNETVD